jgi:hypothetical protein
MCVCREVEGRLRGAAKQEAICIPYSNEGLVVTAGCFGLAAR